MMKERIRIEEDFKRKYEEKRLQLITQGCKAVRDELQWRQNDWNMI